MRTFLLSIVLLLTITSCNSQTKQEAQKSKEMKTIIVDVRSQEEWEYDGHADCSVNYPLDQFASHIEELKQYDKVVMLGDSMGATASLVFSDLATAVVAFCPQVDLTTSAIRPGSGPEG